MEVGRRHFPKMLRHDETKSTGPSQRARTGARTDFMMLSKDSKNSSIFQPQRHKKG